MAVIDVQALKTLKQCRPYLTKQQFYTLKGQILTGNADGALKGLSRILTGGLK